MKRCCLVVLLAAVGLGGCGGEPARSAAPASRSASTGLGAPTGAVVPAATDTAPPNGMASPSPLPRGVGKRVAEVHAIDDDHFWIVAEGGAWESTDAGKTFVDRTPFDHAARPADRAAYPESEWHDVWSVLASPTSVLVLRGDDESAEWMTLFVSADGGRSFAPRRVPRLRYGREAWLQRGPDAASVLVMRTDGNGMNSHATSILETRDAGATFREIGTVTGYGGVTFQTAKAWWSVGACCAASPSLYRSSDSGRTWKTATLASDVWEPVSSFVFADANHGYRVVRRDQTATLVLERTTDGGRSFVRATPPSSPTDVLFADAGACALLDEQGPIVTLDMGATWTSLPSLPAVVTAPRLHRTPHGWLALGDLGNPSSALFALRDGATAWDEVRPSWTAQPAKP